MFNAELNEFLARTLGEDGYAGVEVRVTPIRTEIIIRATRTDSRDEQLVVVPCLGPRRVTTGPVRCWARRGAAFGSLLPWCRSALAFPSAWAEGRVLMSAQYTCQGLTVAADQPLDPLHFQIPLRVLQTAIRWSLLLVCISGRFGTHGQSKPRNSVELFAERVENRASCAMVSWSNGVGVRVLFHLCTGSWQD